MKKILFILTCILLIFTGKSVVAEEFSVEAQHALAIEVSTGKILFDQDGQKSTSIASISKLLSVYLVYEALDKGEIQLSTVVDISDYPYSLTANTQLSNVILDDRSYSVEDLLNASLITSSNSAIIALAEKIAGSESAFVDRMKAKLEEWGITDGKIVNVSGLDNSDLGENIYPNSSPEDANMLSALDIAIIARRLILDFPQVLAITSQNSYWFGGETYYATNQMLSEGTHAREGVDGLKTGTSESAGSCFVATTNQHDMRIITVVLNAHNGIENPENRFMVTNNLMNYIYDNFSLTTFISKGQPFENSSISIFNGQKEKSQAVAASNLNIVQRKHTDKPITAKFITEADTFDAPLLSGHKVGILKLVDKDIIGKGYVDGQTGQLQIDMILPQDIAEANWPASWWNHFVRYVNENL